MANRPQAYDFDRVFRLLLAVGALLATIWLLGYLSDVLVPFAAAVLLAYLLNPLVNAFEERLGSRGAAVGVTVFLVLLFVLILVPLLLGVLWNEFLEACRVLADQNIKDKILQLIEPLVRNSQHIREQVAEFLENTSAEKLQAMAVDLAKLLSPQAGTLTSGLANILGGALNAVLALTVVLIVFIYAVFLMMDFNNFQVRWKDQLPPRYRRTIVELFGEFSTAMSQYFRGQFLVAVCCGVLFAIGFLIVGLRMAVLLGLFIGLLNMVPYLQTIGLVPAVLLALLRAVETDGSVLWGVLGVLVVFGLVQVIQDAVLVPRIMGRATGLKPYVILLSIFIWGKLLGFLGLILAIPLSCLGLAYYRRFILKQVAESPK